MINYEPLEHLNGSYYYNSSLLIQINGEREGLHSFYSKHQAMCLHS